MSFFESIEAMLLPALNKVAVEKWAGELNFITEDGVSPSTGWVEMMLTTNFGGR